MVFCLCLITLFFTVSGSSGVEWQMWVPGQVNSTERYNVILPCTFTHPDQDSYSGRIRVQWKTDQHRYADPFFQCTAINSTLLVSGDKEDYNCSVAAGRFSLRGDPRRGDLSLLIRDAWLNDTRVYFCRVELDGVGQNYQSKSGIKLSVTAPARILSLFQNPFPHNHSLECLAVGNPLPQLTWLSSSSSSSAPVPASVKTDPHDPYTVRSVATITSLEEEEVYTCRAENALGSQERVFPPSKGPAALTVGLGTLAGLLLLVVAGLLAVLMWKRRRRRRRGASQKEETQLSPIREIQNNLPDTDPDIYANCPKKDGNQELLYADINHSSPNSGAALLPQSTVENDIIYSDVNSVDVGCLAN
ncbi:sialic acid binding Ig-like lectin 15, like [Engraulis encrasicolus]|uniref:sialic acid binding Ig-like lectin 15, like n=1 Tax=Engraulis encrasicolus TaxID=184585 RepID=UPI002FD16224